MPDVSLLGLKGKVALVTGGGLGIGKGCALMLARAGCHIAIADMSRADAQQTAKEVKALGRRSAVIEADARTKKGIDAMVKSTVRQLGGLDICVNTVGGLIGHRPAHFLKISEQAYDDVVTNNLRATFWCCRAEAQAMVARKTRGCIINISSIGGMRVMRNLAHYGSAKAAIIYLTQDLAIELAPYGIRVNAIAPGDTLTERAQAAYQAGGFRDVEAVNPLGRMARSQDMGGAAVYLASDLASFVTGHTVVVDGGVSLLTPRPPP